MEPGNAFGLVLGQLPTVVAIALVVGVICAVIAMVARLVKGAPGLTALLVAAETLLTTAVGAILAWLMLRTVLAIAGDTPEAAVVFGTIFLILPGVFDLLWAGPRALFFDDTEPVLIGVGVLPWLGFAVAAGIGLFDGYRRIHEWRRFGVLTFIADCTWGLPLAVSALIMHLWNFPDLFKDDPRDGRKKAVHDDIPRLGNHRYWKGVALKEHFAFTQGSVISNLETGHGPRPGDPNVTKLYFHECTHVFQNRLFGPLFWYLYLFWFVVFAVLAAIMWIFAPSNRGPSPGIVFANDFPFWWAYMNNPWEVWAYTNNPDARIGNHPEAPGWTDGLRVWPAWLVILLAVPVWGAGLVLLFLTVRLAFAG